MLPYSAYIATSGVLHTENKDDSFGPLLAFVRQVSHFSFFSSARRQTSCQPVNHLYVFVNEYSRNDDTKYQQKESEIVSERAEIKAGLRK